ncbi:MAG: hypothetical protein ABIQ66_01070 [Novosphingobium sp.]
MTVRPFRIDVPQPVLDRIAARVAESRIGYAPAEGLLMPETPFCRL